VWVVEATLIPGKRNVAAKRKLYLDEDTWQVVLSDTWDAQGKLWKTGELHPHRSGPAARHDPTYVVYDLQSGAWAYTFSLNSVTSGVKYDKFDSKTLVDYTPSAISGGSAR